jgi:hypothetical protein
VQIAPWEEVAINLIGPWKFKVNGQQVEFNALTCIDTASNLAKLIHVDNKTAKHIRDKFTQSWLCQYPHPVRCLHDKRCEFIGQNFQLGGPAHSFPPIVCYSGGNTFFDALNLAKTGQTSNKRRANFLT